MQKNDSTVRKDSYFTKGKRALLYKGMYGKHDCVIKEARPDSNAVAALRNEGRWLKILNEHSIGPKLYHARDDAVIMEFIDGTHLKDYLQQETSKKHINHTLQQIFKQCFLLDTLKVNKYEMHNVTKNAIVTKKHKAVLIDFERCKIVLEPKNITQYCQFLLKTKLFTVDKKMLKEALQLYKKEQNKRHMKKLYDLFFS